MNRYSISTQFIGQQQIYYPACASTNQEATTLLEQQFPEEGTMIITDHQTAGRGQRGNQWESGAGVNLTFSIIVYPDLLVLHQFYLNMITSLAVAQTLGSHYDNIRIKWPNDVLYNDQKLCGILIQNNLRINKIQSSVIGVGINVNQTGFSFPGITSLTLISGKTVDREKILSELLQNLEKYYLMLKNGYLMTIKQQYLERFYWLGEVKLFRDQQGTFEGVIQGIDDTGRLQILNNGQVKKYDLKEVQYLRG